MSSTLSDVLTANDILALEHVIGEFRRDMWDTVIANCAEE